MTAKCSWPLGNGNNLQFDIYTKENTVWNDVSGLYIFTYITAVHWYPLYVGQADSFKTRLSSHERWDEAVRKGATHVHALAVPQHLIRDLWEGMLIQNLQPPMNVQHRNALSR